MSGCDRSFLPGDGGPTPRTVLVVEDDASTLETLSLFLQDEGYRVLQATSGVAALSLMRQVRPALILSDAIMPGMDGFALCELVRAEPRWSQIPFIFLSGISQRTDVRHGMGLGADDYLAKPVEPEELLSAIRVRLARADEAQVALTNATSDLRDAIIRTLSHEFRTPLSLVLGYTDLIESTIRETADQELHQFLQGLRSGVEHLMGLLEGFLLLSQLQTGALAAERRREPPQSSLADLIVSQVLEGFDQRALQQNIRLSLLQGAPGSFVATDGWTLAEIVGRLVDNAFKFSKPGGGCVVVATRLSASFWVFEVADEGIGITEQELTWIFEAFRQVDRAKMEQQGTGLGLAIVRGLAELSGGSVAVDSEPGRGSTFSVRLPLAAQEEPVNDVGAGSLGERAYGHTVSRKRIERVHQTGERNRRDESWRRDDSTDCTCG